MSRIDEPESARTFSLREQAILDSLDEQSVEPLFRFSGFSSDLNDMIAELLVDYSGGTAGIELMNEINVRCAAMVDTVAHMPSVMEVYGFTVDEARELLVELVIKDSSERTTMLNTVFSDEPFKGLDRKYMKMLVDAAYCQDAEKRALILRNGYGESLAAHVGKALQYFDRYYQNDV